MPERSARGRLASWFSRLTRRGQRGLSGDFQGTIRAEDDRRPTTADGVWWEDDVLHFSTGERIENGLLFSEDGTQLEAEAPLQVFTRWYGFSLTFPDTEIYGDPSG